MGIKNLNRFLRENCGKKSIRKIQLSHLENKIIVVDTSIYMYRYLSENALMENMYMLVSLLLANKITPLFVFDGKPPPEKRELLRLRRIEKKKAEHKYEELMNEYNKDVDLSLTEKQALLQQMNELKQQFVRLTENDIQQVKDLLTAYGVMYYESQSEADTVCAYMVKSGKAWACLSDDMDMFVYGCNCVLRNISLLNKTVILYDTTSILEELCMTEDVFRQIMVLSGTDYNTHTETNLDTTINWYTKYISSIASVNNSNSQSMTFYDWVCANGNYIDNKNELLIICDLFTINHIPEMGIDTIQITSKPSNQNMIHDIMSKAGFVFT